MPREPPFAVLFRQLLRYGRGRVRLWRKHPDTFTLGLVPPTLLAAGLVVGLPLSFVSVWFAFAYIAAIAIYAAVLLTTSTVIAVRQRRFGLCYLLPSVFFTIHFASGAGILRELFRPEGRTSRQ